ncbi:MAG: FAD-dependent oxidoreductase [Elusimicrobiota bacterium]
MREPQSWGRIPHGEDQLLTLLSGRADSLPTGDGNSTLLPFGQGRSYGDSCLNPGGILLGTRRLNGVISFDRDRGVMRCESGATFEDILRRIVPCGWFLPVAPGTKFISVGGAIANDVHGKNHQGAGTFGRHVTRFELLRSDGTRRLCSQSENPSWFAATIGGLGLTGLITWAEFQLKRIESSDIEMETVKFRNLDEFFEVSRRSDEEFEHTVAWVDCAATAARLGRGLFMRGRHAGSGRGLFPSRKNRLELPLDAPGFVTSPPAMRLFNAAHYHGGPARIEKRVVHYERFFYPLDAIGRLNRIYGTRGFFQYQCVVPFDGDGGAVKALIGEISMTGGGSFSSILKNFGDIKSPGMLSFPRKGVTLAVDFPNRGRETLDLLERLDTIVRECRGAVYPAKDARMSAESFDAYFPNWKQWVQYKDPLFSSGFWRRVTRKTASGE